MMIDLEARYRILELHCHGCVECDRRDSLAEAKALADDYQRSYDNRNDDDGWGSTWIVTRAHWYPGDHVVRLHETTPNRKAGAQC